MAKIQRTRCNGTLTEAGLKGRIISWLRKGSMYWAPKQTCAKKHSSGTVINPKTGRPNQAIKCVVCNESIPKKDIKMDHIEPVVPLDGWDDSTRFLGINFNQYLRRLLVEEEGYQPLCEKDHKVITDEENRLRREYKQKQKEK